MNSNTVKRWMRRNISNHIDRLTGEVNLTELAEDCAESLFNRAASEAEFEAAYNAAVEAGLESGRTV